MMSLRNKAAFFVVLAIAFALVAAVALVLQSGPARGEHIAGATYTRTIEGGHSMTLDISPDGSTFTFNAPGPIPGNFCDFTNTGKGGAIQADHTFSSFGVTGAFPSAGTAEGTVTITDSQSGCTTGSLTWSATAPTPPPPGCADFVVDEEVFLRFCISLDPPTATNEAGSDHTVTATVTAGLGLPVQEADVEFDVTDGPNAGDNNGQGTALDVNGQADFTYTGDSGAGTDTIQACLVDFPEVCITATKDWVEPAATSTPTPTPTVLAATATPAAAALPTAGGAPSDGGSGALPWLVAIVGAIALGVAATAARRWRLSATSTGVIGTRDGRDGGWTWMRPGSGGRPSRRQ